METASGHRVSVDRVVRGDGELGVEGPLVAVLTGKHGAAQAEKNVEPNMAVFSNRKSITFHWSKILVL